MPPRGVGGPLLTACCHASSNGMGWPRMGACAPHPPGAGGGADGPQPSGAALGGADGASQPPRAGGAAGAFQPCGPWPLSVAGGGSHWSAPGRSSRSGSGCRSRPRPGSHPGLREPLSLRRCLPRPVGCTSGRNSSAERNDPTTPAVSRRYRGRGMDGSSSGGAAAPQSALARGVRGAADGP